MSVEIRSAYSIKEKKSFSPVGETLTKQSFKQECDINYILKKAGRSGLVEHVNAHQGDYSDVSQNLDYHQAMNVVLQAQEAFGSLPAQLRRQFDNDPGNFLAFVENPDNLEAMYDLGLAKRPEPVEETPPAEQPPAAVE